MGATRSTRTTATAFVAPLLALGCASPSTVSNSQTSFGTSSYQTGFYGDDSWRGVGPPGPLGWDEYGSFRFGERDFRTSALPDSDAHLVAGIELWGHPQGASWDLEFGLWASAPSDGDLSDWSESVSDFPGDEDEEGLLGAVEGSSSLEFSAGVRRELSIPSTPFGLHGSVGVSGLRARAFRVDGEGEEFEDSDGVLGGYAQAGWIWGFRGGRFDLSFRWFRAEEVRLFDQADDLSYFQWSFGLAFAF